MSQELLGAYADRLAEEGDLLGLTSLRDRERILHELVLDSLAGAEWIPEGAHVLDVGSGGGCPGIPLAIARPDCQFVLVEANGRKAGFLERTVQTLGLSHVKVVAQRSEDLAHRPEYRARYDIVVAKAVAAVPALVELCLPFLKVKAQLIAYKGPSLEQELAVSGHALHELKGKVTRTHPYTNGERQMILCEITKLAPTPKRYPRRPGIPAKQPL